MRTSDRDADFTEFVTASGPRLRRAAYLLTHQHHDAEDLLQSVLVKAYVAWPRVRRAEAFSYVSRSLVNAYVDQHRRRGRVTLTEDVETTGPAPSVEPDERLEDRTVLVRLLEPLSPRERSMLVLRYYLDRSEAEVAEQLGVSVGTVKSTASRALSRVRSSVIAPDSPHDAPSTRRQP